MAREAFHTTQATWFEERIQARDHEALNQHVMSLYREPLKVYYLGSSLRGLGDADEVVQEFFAEWLQRKNFLTSWRRTDRMLRRHLINGFHFFLREYRRRHARHQREQELDEELPAEGEEVAEQFDRAYARQLVQRALEEASEACRKQDLGQHWQVFRLHFFDGLPYREIAASMHIREDRAAVMSRTARRRFEVAFLGLLGREHVSREQIFAELQCLMEVVRA